MFKNYILLLLLAFCFAACKKENLCLQYASNTGALAFKTYNDSLQLKDTILPAPLLVYTNFGTQFNSTNRVNFYLDGRTVYTSAVLYPDSNDLDVYDSIYFYYKPSLNFVSKECGYNYNYTLDSIRSTKTHIKNTILLNAAITNKTNILHAQVIY